MIHLRFCTMLAAVAFTVLPLTCWAANPAEDACIGLREGSACRQAKLPGNCQTSECCRPDYAHRKAGSAPPQICRPCLACAVQRPALEQLEIPLPAPATAELPTTVTPVVALPTAPSLTVAATANGEQESKRDGWLPVAIILALVASIGLRVWRRKENGR